MSHPRVNHAEVRRLYVDELRSVEWIADALETSVGTVYRTLRRMGVRTRRRGPGPLCTFWWARRQYEESLARAWEMRVLREGEKLTHDEIAERYGMTRQWVGKLLQRVGAA